MPCRGHRKLFRGAFLRCESSTPSRSNSFAEVPKRRSGIDSGISSNRMGTLDVLDLLFTPIPQFLPKFGVESLLVGERDTCPSSEILKRVIYRATKLWNRNYLLCHSAQPQQGRCLRIKSRLHRMRHRSTLFVQKDVLRKNSNYAGDPS